MKYKNKIVYKYLLIYTCLILQAKAARPFNSSTGLTGSYGGPSFSMPTSVGGLSLTELNFGTNSPHYTFRSIADSKIALRSKSIGSSSLNKSQNKIQIYAENFGSVDKYSKQPPYNPYYNKGPFQHSVHDPVKDIAKPPAHNQFYKFEPTAPTAAYTAKSLMPQQSNYKQVSNVVSTAVNYKPLQPAYNPFLKTAAHNLKNTLLRKRLPTSSTINRPSTVLNNNLHGEATNVNKPTTLHNLNSTHTVAKNITQTNCTFTDSPMDFINNFPHYKTLNSNAENDNKYKINKICCKNGFIHAKIINNPGLRLQGHTTSTISQHNIVKFNHEINKNLQNQYTNNWWVRQYGNPM